MDSKNRKIAAKIIGESYISIASDNLNTFSKNIKILLTQRQLPTQGWSDLEIESLLLELSRMDTNNFSQKAGVGEREGRVVSSLVKKRNYHLGHGIGRSGTVDAIQPKAPGSSLLLKICKYLVLDAIKSCSGVQFAKDCVVLPSATGISLLLCLLAFRSKKPDAKYVIWPRIDQKTCLKCIFSAGYIPVVIENKLIGDKLHTDLEAVKLKIEELGAENVLGILSTTSCFAPRVPDDIPGLSKLCKEFDLFHLVNNAYGLQCKKISNLLNQGNSLGRIDAVVQSTDKNYMVPVGGSIIFSKNKKLIQDISSTYPGRASSSPIIDLTITLLSMGKEGLNNFYKERKQLYKYFIEKL